MIRVNSLRDILTTDVPSVAPRPLSARSVVASTLLGADPPELPVRTIVRCGGLFGIGAGAVRTAVSRMVADGSLVLDAERRTYGVGGRLAARLARQGEGRSLEGSSGVWDGTWDEAVVHEGARSAADRVALRSAATVLRLGRLREGVWLRPANLDPDRHPDAARTVATQTVWLQARPEDPVGLASTLWDLAGWAATARTLEVLLAGHLDDLDGGDPAALADGFLLSAAVLRHLVADPLLPTELTGATWPGTSLRSVYDDYDRRYKARWRAWFRAEADR